MSECFIYVSLSLIVGAYFMFDAYLGFQDKKVPKVDVEEQERVAKEISDLKSRMNGITLRLGMDSK